MQLSAIRHYIQFAHKYILLKYIISIKSTFFFFFTRDDNLPRNFSGLQSSSYPQEGVQPLCKLIPDQTSVPFCLCEKRYSCGSACYFEGHQSAIIKDSFNSHPNDATGDHIFGIWCTFLTITHLTTSYTPTIYVSLGYITAYKA